MKTTTAARIDGLTAAEAVTGEVAIPLPHLERIAFKAQDVAEMLNVPLSRVRRHTRARLFPCHRMGTRMIRYTREDIAKYLERCAQPGFPKRNSLNIPGSPGSRPNG